MTPAELQAWLVEDGIRDELRTLIRNTIRSEVENLEADVYPAPEPNWTRLILAGSILARSSDRRDLEAALRIGTAAAHAADVAIRDAGAVLLDKASNFRARALAIERGLVPDDLDGRLGVGLRLEAQRRNLEGAVVVERTGALMRLNPFQREFWSKASEADWLSASAPTASGKTWLVLQWLQGRLAAGDVGIAVYLAPTRALVSEIEGNLRTLLADIDGVVVSSIPLPSKYDAARAGGPRLVLVFTQERLHLLANAVAGDLVVDLLVVDEAHKIGDDGRGVILQDAIERCVRANPLVRLVFVSPATRNPEELLTDAPPGVRAAAVESDAPTVLQNLILARQVPGRPKLWTLDAQQADGAVPIGVLKLATKGAGSAKRLAFVAAAATGSRGGTLVYVNGAGEAEKVAGLISQLQDRPEAKSVDPELADLAELSRKTVHAKFLLASVVETGVAFHFGNMPSLMRQEIERLFRIGKLRFLVCTSTLVEGVNLSCRTIVVRGPRKGMGNPMEPHDFWNLAGRAGRWGDEFQGNVVCLDPDDRRAWPDGVPSRTRFPIVRESDSVLGDGSALLGYLAERAARTLSDSDPDKRFEQVGAYLLTTFMRSGSVGGGGLAKRHGAALVKALDDVLGRLAEGIEIDADLAQRHPGVSPIGMQSLLEAFRTYRGPIENLLPADVASEDVFDRFVTIMRRINRTLFPAFEPDARTRLYALIVVQWLRGLSLSRIIAGSIEWHDEVGRPYQLPLLIRETMSLVEQVARFLAPKYMSAYVDVLRFYLRESGREDLLEDDVDIGTQLELGISSRTLLSLVELGLSRSSAVELFERIARDDLGRAECVAWIRRHDAELEGMGIPAVVIREIRAVEATLSPADGG